MKRTISSAVLVAMLLAASSSTASELDAGKAIFERECIACHGVGGDRPGTLQLGITRGADKALLAERSDLSVAYIRHVVRHGLNSMPAFTPAGLTDTELNQLAAYLTQH